MNSFVEGQPEPDGVDLQTFSMSAIDVVHRCTPISMTTSTVRVVPCIWIETLDDSDPHLGMMRS